MTGATVPVVRLELSDAATGGPVDFVARHLVIAGYTGRDAERVRRHIDELAAIGVPPPASVPAFYDVPPSLLDRSGAVEVGTPTTSGEVEPVLFCGTDGWYVGLGSDHTDRELERTSIPASKAACPKPIAARVLPAETVIARWDELTLRSWNGGRRYQEAPLADLLPLTEVVEAYRRSVGEPADGLVLFLGTVPSLTGEFHYGDSFAAELADGDVPLLTCSYEVRRKA